MATPSTKRFSLGSTGKELQIDLKAVFWSITKGAVKYALNPLNPASPVNDIVDTLRQVKVKDTPEHAGFLLVTRSLNQAMNDLVGEATSAFDSLLAEGELHKEWTFTDDAKELWPQMERQEIELTEAFFTHPKNFEPLAAFQAALAQALAPLMRITKALPEGLEATPQARRQAQARALAERLPGYFVYALRKELRHPNRKAQYQLIFDNQKTEVDAAWRREQEWNDYLAYLQRLPQEPVFEETFSLESVYLPHRGYYEVEVDGPNREGAKIRRYALKVDEHLLAWAGAGKEPIKVLAGGPGSGKSSLSKLLCAQLASANTGLKPLLLPLQALKVEGDLVDAVGKYLVDDRQQDFTTNPLADFRKHKEKLLLVFDGLDELAKQGKSGQELARDFAEKARELANKCNQGEAPCLWVLITGRDVPVHAVESKFAKEGQVLHLLPYHNRKDSRGNFVNEQGQAVAYGDTKALLAEDMRNRWWQQYGAQKGLNITAMPENLHSHALDDITAQPLLNYLVALTYEGGLKIGEDTNLNEVYARLLNDIFDRRWDERYQHAEGIKANTFKQLLEEVAWVAWAHGEVRRTNLRRVKEHLANKQKLNKALEALAGDLEGGLLKLFTAFYFRKQGEDKVGDPTFEFTHKSFGEYLLASRLVRALRSIARMWTGYETEDGDEVEAKPKEALAEWLKFFGPQAIDENLFAFIAREVGMPTNQKKAATWQSALVAMLAHAAKHQLPAEGMQVTYKEMGRQAINAEMAILAMHNACATVTAQVSELPGTVKGQEFHALLHRQRLTYRSNDFERYVLGWRNITLKAIDFSESNYVGADWRIANLNKARLSGISLISASLNGASLDGASLDGASLYRARLDGASLYRARLDGASLVEASLEEARLDGARLEEASLDGARLDRASLDGASLDRARLDGARLYRARLYRARLDRASLDGASLDGASLDGASLDGASLDRARLDGASLYRASLDGASLDGASLDRARLDGARLDGASLYRARLDGARLDGARLDGARLDGARLDGASLDGASLDGASLDGASLDGARLYRASLDRARLDGASLDGASLYRARLDGARLDGARLDGASLDGARLDRARLDRARLDGASLMHTKLHGAIGLTYEQLAQASTLYECKGIPAEIETRLRAEKPELFEKPEWLE